MKKILFVVAAWLAMSTLALAGWEGVGFYMIGGGGTNVHYFTEKPNNPNITFVGGLGGDGSGDAYADAKAKAEANAKAVAKQNQKQSQKQSQKQGQNQTAVGVVSVSGDTYTVEKPYMNAPGLVQTDVPLLQTGKIGDFTGAVPNIENLKPLENETVIKVIAVYSGNIFWRIRLEDVVTTLIEKNKNLEGKVCYSIWFKDSVTSGCVGLPLSGSAVDNGMAGTIGSTNGYCQSTSNPQFVITFYEVK